MAHKQVRAAEWLPRAEAKTQTVAGPARQSGLTPGETGTWQAAGDKPRP